MKPISFSRHARFCSNICTLLCLAGLGAGFAFTAESQAAGALRTEFSNAGCSGGKLISYGNLLLIISTLLYVAHLWFKARAVGLWATGLAILGVLGLFTGLLTQKSQTHLGQYLNSLSEVMTLFCAVTVLLYLIMEKMYRTRSAGAFVMPIVAAAITFGAMEGSQNQLQPVAPLAVLISYWMDAHILTGLSAYSTFSLSAAMAVMFLRGQHQQQRTATGKYGFSVRFSMPKIEHAMYQAIGLGFILLSVTILLGLGINHLSTEESGFWRPQNTLALIIWLNYAAYLYMHHAKHWQGDRMAYWAIIGFSLTVLCFFAS